ncbi:NrsF family protein [Myxococcaceae bacterium GXIMD 01537]
MTPDCARVLDALGGPLPADLAAHVAACENCRALTEGFDALGAPQVAPAPALPTQVKAPALAELASHPQPTPWWREVLLLGTVYMAVTAGAMSFTRAGALLNTSPPWVVAGLAALVLAVMAGGAVVALAPARRGAWGLVGTSAAVVALAVVLGGSGLGGRGLLAGCLGCTRAHMLLSALPLVAALVLLRRSAYHPARALAAGLSAGAVGLLMLHLHCPNGSPAHLALSHVAPWLLVGGLAVLVRSRLGSRTYAP